MLNSQQLNDIADEEERTAEMYDDQGFHKQARDERRHAKFFRKLAEKC